ncbi:putative fructosyl amino acid oxidase protein [Phaeoacremonium minimum UCRPA7]|uniref:Putative fructosyl amino acid oxidase protein n=1 Tax=Phaeoacremonium minimum (strain UCR-PA7) TaxID=1286976 RepID=R8BPT2_PHAM7|nr:putative fructosyl amino acid oxidase protein [Phaeoacremonium minimum UCRPA7]EOO01388.1 putative fructosyl amino acid oxidase protein [Phaeoacremonium minimum UCRPA7]
MAASKGSQNAASSLAGKSILFVGGGTFGVSAAYHLADRLDLAASKTTITIVDRFESPSPIAASTDLNKIVRSDYSEPMYARLGVEAMNEWKKKTGMFAGMFKQTGWFLAAQNVSIPFIETSVANQEKLGIKGVKKVTPEEARKISPSFTGSMEDWQIWWNPWAGWTTSGDALAAMTTAAKQLGVKYVSGDDGWIKKLLYAPDGTCIGAEAASGARHYADKVVVSAGATSASLLDFEGQLQAKGHVVGHIQLSPQEAEKYASLKIVDHFEQGILFPPNRDGIIKVATVNFVTNVEDPEKPGLSLPRFRQDNPRDDVPRKIEGEIRAWMREFVPSLADKPWSETRICWDTDTQDLHFLIDKHPKHKGLYLATGGSAHGFKFLPIIGKYVADMLESKLDPSLAETWAWRPGWQRKSHGPDPHPYPTRDLAEFEDFKPMRASKL